jgi:hypothetical protein
MKKAVLIITTVLFACQISTAQSIKEEVQKQKTQFSYKELVSLSKSRDYSFVVNFMASKGWYKHDFEVNKDDEAEFHRNHSGKLPFFTDDVYQFGSKMPKEYRKLIFSCNTRYSYGIPVSDWCYVYLSDNEESAIAFSMNTAYEKRLIDNGMFKRMDDVYMKQIYRNDTYELVIDRGIHFFFYNYRQYEERKAEEERLALEEERRNAQERREQAQRKAEEERQRAALGEKYTREGLAAYITFDDGKVADVAGRVKIAVKQLDSSFGSTFHETDVNSTNASFPNFIGDTPAGSGKAVEFVKDKKHYFEVESTVQNVQNNGYTVSFWIKDFGTGQIFSRKNINNNGTYLMSPIFSCSSTGYFQLLRNNTSAITFGDATAFMFDQWHLLTLVYDENDSKSIYSLYVDGKLSGDYSENVKQRGKWYKHNWIFGDWVSGSDFYDGHNITDMKLDNIRIYYRALSAEEVAGIWEDEKP